MKSSRDEQHDGGFTLIEMVVAVLIVAVMMAVVTPHLIGAGEQAQRTACEQNQRTIRAGLAEYKLLNGNYPSGNAAEQLTALVTANILDEVPKEPSNGTYNVTITDANGVVVDCSIHDELGK